MNIFAQRRPVFVHPEPADITQYEADGAVVIQQLLPPSVVKDLKAGWQELKEQIAQGQANREARFVWSELPRSLAAVCRHEALVKTAQAILGISDISLYMNRLLLKDEKWSGAVEIHQDMPYFSGGLSKLSLFIPLTPTSARNGNGGLIFLKGSHKYGNLQRGHIRRELFPPMEELAPDLEAGDVVLMNFLTWHYSENAAHPADRPLLQIVYQPASDGSYGSAKLGVSKPTLVCGKWMTEHFAAWGECTIPDV